MRRYGEEPPEPRDRERAKDATIRDACAGDAAGIAAIWNPIIRDTAITFWPTERSVMPPILRTRSAMS